MQSSFMRLAYYIAVHRSVEQFRWLFSAIYNEADVFAIHVDRKAGDAFYESIRQVVGPKPNVHFIPRRSVAWSGWSFCLAELDGLQMLLSEPDWSYCINLSGQCYPIKPMAAIREHLAQSWPQNFVRAVPFDSIVLTEPDDVHLKRTVVFEFMGKIRYMPITWPKHPLVNWKGSTWHTLSRSFCEWIFASRAMRKIPLSLKYAFCPDELLFQSLVMAGPFRDILCDPDDWGRLVIWPGPKVLTMNDWDQVSNSKALFARKFDLQKDGKIMHRLAEVNGLQVPDEVSVPVA